MEILQITAIPVAALLGYHYRTLRDAIKTLNDKIDTREPEVGATPASYGPVNELNRTNQGGIGISNPKTPQMLEWEEQEQLRRDQLNVKVVK